MESRARGSRGDSRACVLLPGAACASSSAVWGNLRGPLFSGCFSAQIPSLMLVADWRRFSSVDLSE